jgi:hypothetical protein
MTILPTIQRFQTYEQLLTQFLIWNTLLKMKILAYNLGEVVDKAPASGAFFFRTLIKGSSNRNKTAKQEAKTCCHEFDLIKTESTGGVHFLQKLFSRREGMCQDDSESTLQTYTSMLDDEEEEDEESFHVQLSQPCQSEFTLRHKVPKPAMCIRDQPTNIAKKTPAPRPTPLIKDTHIPLELKLVVHASCRGEEVDKPPYSAGAFISRKSRRGSNGSKTDKIQNKVSFRSDKPKSELNIQAPQSFYQLMMVDGNLVPKRVYPEPRAFYQLILVNGNLVPKRVTQSPSH